MSVMIVTNDFMSLAEVKGPTQAETSGNSLTKMDWAADHG